MYLHGTRVPLLLFISEYLCILCTVVSHKKRSAFMRTPHLLLLLFCLAIGSNTQGVFAQFGGHFGASVATDNNQIFIVKPGGAFGGVASVYVFGANGDAWQETQRLYPISSGETGEAMSPSLSVQNGTLVVGALDPLLQWSGHVFTSSDGAWEAAQRIPADTTVDTTPAASMSVNDFMQFVQPAPRTTAYNGSLVAVSIRSGNSPLTGVHLYKQEADEWMLLQTLRADDENITGNTLAWGDDFLVVGNSQGGNAGIAHIFQEDEAGAWVHTSTLTSENIAEGAGLARSIAILGNQVFLGAPGQRGMAGTVLGFERKDDGSWEETVQIDSPSSTPGDQFGRALAFVGEELWIGAPMTDQAKGAVYRAQWNSEVESYALSAIQSDKQAAGWAFGSSIAGTEQLAVIGSPGANSGDGHAAVLTKGEAMTWQINNWLLPDPPLQPITGSEAPCEEGKSLSYDCEEVDLLAFLPIADFGGAAGERVSDIWGWTDPLNDREFALIGRTGGAAIVDVTNPTLPIYMGLVTANPTNVRDLKVYKNHLFFTGDGAGNHGLVIFDLTRLRAINDPPSAFKPDTVYTGIASAHNLILDEDSGFAYPVGASGGGETCGGGLHMVDIRDPLNPSFAGCYEDTIGLFSDGRTHDGQCVVYQGPDSRYSGRQICLASNETGLRIVDVTDKENPEPISVARYPRVAYVHQGWLTDDHRYFYLNDELDELVGMTPNTRTMVWDIAELDDPVLVGEFQGNTTATDHNLYIKGNRMYQANYESGLRVWDVSNPEQPREIGYFDTTPNDKANPPGFFGAWTAYPYFESGTVIVSSIGEGLFIVKPREQEMP